MKRFFLFLVILAVGQVEGASWIDNNTFFLGSGAWYRFYPGYNLTGEWGYVQDNLLWMNGDHVFNVSPTSSRCNVTLINWSYNYTLLNISCPSTVNVSVWVGNFTVNMSLWVDGASTSNLSPSASGYVNFSHTNFSTTTHSFLLVSNETTTTTTTTTTSTTTTLGGGSTPTSSSSSTTIPFGVESEEYTVFTYLAGFIPAVDLTVLVPSPLSLFIALVLLLLLVYVYYRKRKAMYQKLKRLETRLKYG